MMRANQAPDQKDANDVVIPPARDEAGNLIPAARAAVVDRLIDPPNMAFAQDLTPAELAMIQEGFLLEKSRHDAEEQDMFAQSEALELEQIRQELEQIRQEEAFLEQTRLQAVLDQSKREEAEQALLEESELQAVLDNIKREEAFKARNEEFDEKHVAEVDARADYDLEKAIQASQKLAEEEKKRARQTEEDVLKQALAASLGETCSADADQIHMEKKDLFEALSRSKRDLDKVKHQAVAAQPQQVVMHFQASVAVPVVENPVERAKRATAALLAETPDQRKAARAAAELARKNKPKT